MGKRERYLSPTHFSIHCRVSFLSGLCLWSHRSLLLFSTMGISSLSLLLSSLFSTKRTSLFSILHQHKGNSCLDRLSSHVSLCVRYTVPWNCFFPLTRPSCTCIPQSYLTSLVIFPTSKFVEGSGQKHKILVPELKNLTFYSDCVMATLPWS